MTKVDNTIALLGGVSYGDSDGGFIFGILVFVMVFLFFIAGLISMLWSILARLYATVKYKRDDEGWVDALLTNKRSAPARARAERIARIRDQEAAEADETASTSDSGDASDPDAR